MKADLHFSRTLSAEMRSRDIKPAALAREIGLSHVAVGNWLKEEKPSIPDAYQLLRLARHFNVSMEYLLTGDTSKPAVQTQATGVSRGQIKQLKQRILDAVAAAFSEVEKI